MPTLPSIFSDHMVLQCEHPIPIWGSASPGASIRIELAGVSAETLAGADGSFRVVLPALPPGGPHELIVSGDESLRIHDVLLGEVWLCVGQSNMLWPVAACTGVAEILASAERPGLRLCAPPVPGTPQAGDAVRWSRSSATAAAAFSAVAYLSGCRLRESLGRPVGLIQAAWGGTHIEAWMAHEDLLADPATRRYMERFEELSRLGKPPAVPDPLPEHARAWKGAAFDASTWPRLELPGCWQQRGLFHHGVVWFRRRVPIPSAWVGHGLELSIGACAQVAQVFVDGVEIPADATGCRPVPGAASVDLAIRVTSRIDASGLFGPAEAMFLACGAERIPLHGSWHYQVESRHPLADIAISGCVGHPQNQPHLLYDTLIAPLVGLGMRGLLWYQAEQNAWSAWDYRTRFPKLIRDWRRRWGQGDFPVAFVQMPNAWARAQAPQESAWAELREAQTLALREPATAMAVTIDLGEADLHPRDKREVGRRLAAAALALAYDRPEAHVGPRLRAQRVDGNAIVVTLEVAQPPLRTRDGQAVRGFALAGADRRFHWAEAVIEGNELVVWSPDVAHPIAVRHAWAENPDCNLCDAAGLPAEPFRSDDWPGLTMTG